MQITVCIWATVFPLEIKGFFISVNLFNFALWQQKQTY